MKTKAIKPASASKNLKKKSEPVKAAVEEKPSVVVSTRVPRKRTTVAAVAEPANKRSKTSKPVEGKFETY